jgi:hypothetical protein
VKNNLTCREATRLLLEDQDHELPAAERLTLQVHVGICSACQRFVSQVNLMRRAMSTWRKHAESLDDDPSTP